MSAELVQAHGLLALGVGLFLAALLVGRANRQLLPAVLMLVGVAAIAGWMHQRRELPPMPPAGIRLPAGAIDLPSPVIESRARRLHGFELEDFQLAHAFDFAEEGLRQVALDPNGRWAAVHHRDGRIAFLDLETREGVSPTTVGRSRATSVHSLAFSPDGRRLAVGLMGRAKVLEVPTGTQALDLEFPTPPGARTSVVDLAIAPSGDVLVATGHPDLVFQDLRSGQGIGTLRFGEHGFARLAWSRDGRSLAAAGAGRRWIVVWPTSDLSALDGHRPLCQFVLARDQWVDDLAFGMDDEVLVASLGSEGGEARLAVWEAESCEPRGSYPLGTARTLALSLTPDGAAALVFTAAGTLGAIRLHDGATVGTLQTDLTTNFVLLSGAGQRLLLAPPGDDRLLVFEPL